MGGYSLLLNFEESQVTLFMSMHQLLEFCMANSKHLVNFLNELLFCIDGSGSPKGKTEMKEVRLAGS